MTTNPSNAGKTEFTYEATMSNEYKAQFSLFSGNETEKLTYLKHFLEVSRAEDVYFVDKLTGKLYNKNHIVSVEEKGA
jgi:hypothetical protein